jgi:dUTP pyrophosphatase
MNIPFKKLYPNSVAPFRKNKGDAAFDLTVHSMEPWDNCAVMFRSGIAMEIPEGYFGLIRPRSSMAMSRYVVGASGVIDSSYRGEIMFCLKNMGCGTDYAVGDRFCQIMILPLPEVDYVEVSELSATSRGSGGFGSTGR